jgi:hypothetical protein
MNITHSILPKPEYGVFEKTKKKKTKKHHSLKQCEKMLKNMGFSNKTRNNLKSTLLTFFGKLIFKII